MSEKIDSWQLTITAGDVKSRLDKTLALYHPDLSRNRLQSLVADGNLLLNGKVFTSASYKVRLDDKIHLTLPPPVSVETLAQDIPLEILHEDECLIVLNKPAGMVVHPAEGNWDGTLVNALLWHCGDSLKGIGGEIRPGIVHRLDKDTSGIMVVAKDEVSLNFLAEQFSERTLSRHYVALCWGRPYPAEGEIESALGRHPRNRKKMAVVHHDGKYAKTYFKVLERFGIGIDKGAASLVQCKLATGRTHQIRVHMTEIGHSIIGDPLYGRTTKDRLKQISDNVEFQIFAAKRQMLHARTLGFIHPQTKEEVFFEIEPPQDFQDLADALREMTACS
jgi:23S rRNA pseudouridine1911/1915/1917 synthase